MAMELIEHRGDSDIYLSDDRRFMVEIAPWEHDPDGDDALNHFLETGEIDRFIPATLKVSTYLSAEGGDGEGGAFEIYNPTILADPEHPGTRSMLAPEWMLEATPENVECILEAAEWMRSFGIRERGLKAVCAGRELVPGSAYILAEVPQSADAIAIAEVSIDRTPGSEETVQVIYDGLARQDAGTYLIDADWPAIKAAVEACAPESNWVRHGLDNRITDWGFKEDGTPWTVAEIEAEDPHCDSACDLHPLMHHDGPRSIGDMLGFEDPEIGMTLQRLIDAQAGVLAPGGFIRVPAERFEEILGELDRMARTAAAQLGAGRANVLLDAGTLAARGIEPYEIEQMEHYLADYPAFDCVYWSEGATPPECDLTVRWDMSGADFVCGFTLDFPEAYSRHGEYELPREEAARLWGELGDIAIDEQERIEDAWHGFPAGTPRESIWHWFEETYPVSVAVDFMGQLPSDGAPAPHMPQVGRFAHGATVVGVYDDKAVLHTGEPASEPWAVAHGYDAARNTWEYQEPFASPILAFACADPDVIDGTCAYATRSELALVLGESPDSRKVSQAADEVALSCGWEDAAARFAACAQGAAGVAEAAAGPLQVVQEDAPDLAADLAAAERRAAGPGEAPVDKARRL